MLKGFQSAVNLRKWDLGLRPTLLAVSGGVDSVVMARLFALAGFPFVMAHMNFGLRGRESAEDAQFVADLARELGVECIVEKGDVKGYRKQNGVSVQMAARDLRYEFFRCVMQERGIERLATAHHADDNLEHFFVYLYRGNMDVAWRGIWAEQGDVIRPMLGYRKEALILMAQEQSWTWREDGTNQGIDYLRNKVRHALMSGLEEFVGEFYAISQQVQSLDTEGKAMAEAVWMEECGEGWISQGYLARCGGENRNPFYRHLQQHLMGLGFSKSQVDQALTSKQVGSRFTSEGHILWIGRMGWSVLSKEVVSPSAIAIEWGEGEWKWGDLRLVIERVAVAELVLLTSRKAKNTGDLVDNTHEDSYYFADALAGKSVVIRSWVNGDVIVGFGGGSQKLSDVFVNQKIEPWAKDYVAVMTCSEGILCAVEVKRSNLYRVEETDGYCWRLRWLHK
ncbi:MAG: tRNA lysidine(34) synthetase TilS [Bacteroidetes bacterium]|nr:tRNA lysidine(34) synthetase TilS [Bacteroidota bacterium]